MLHSQRRYALELLSLTVACSDTCHLQDCFVWILIPPSGAFDLQIFKVFFSCYEDLHYGTIDEDPWVSVTFLARFAVSVKSFFVSSARPIPKQLSRPHSIASHEKKTSGTQGRSTCAIKTIKDCTSIEIKVCYLCWHCFLTHICREQWIRSCCDQWFGCDF